jgi:hypothetical protein
VLFEKVEDRVFAFRCPGNSDCRECSDPAVVIREPDEQGDIEHDLAD